jgi:general secretion pathway protein B
MSYILDALRRADAERERGRVPGLHAQAMPLRTGDAEPAQRLGRPAGARRSIPVVAMFALSLLLAAVAWWFFGAARAPAADAPVPAPSPAAPSAVAPPPSTAPGTPSGTPPVTPPATPQATTEAPRAAPPILAPAPTPALAPAPAPAAAPRPAADARPTPTEDEQALPRVADLAPPARAGLPPLQISGTTYAENPALRMLIVDGKVVQEGQDIAPGLRLEAIGPRSAVLNHQGRRLRLTY